MISKFLFVIAMIPSSVFAGELADEASAVGGSLTAHFRTCADVSESCQIALDNTLKNLKGAGFSILKVVNCYNQVTHPSSSFIACPDGKRAEKLGSIYFVK